MSTTVSGCGIPDVPCWTGVRIALSNHQLAAAVCVVSMHYVAMCTTGMLYKHSLYKK